MKQAEVLRVELGEELKAGKAVALDGEGNLIAELRVGKDDPPATARVVRLSLKDFQRFEAFAARQLKGR
ncbi:MAG: hypothetical protein IT535_01950 [Bauldia sp.]|nr:hypothetical protein [Bauldia sp.]